MSDTQSPSHLGSNTSSPMNKERANSTRDFGSNEMDKNEALQSSRSQGSRVSNGKKKKAKKPLSIEDIFDKVSNVTSSNINPPPAKVVLTPRSAEVCLKYGINPEVLKVRDIDSFWEAGIDPSVQRLRHEAYVQRRYELMKQCRTERKRLINAELNKSEDAEILTDTPKAEVIAKQQKDAMNATLIENEKNRLEKLRRRQEKELEQMLQYEMSRVKQQKEIEKRMESAKQQETMRQKQQEKRVKLMAEERRLRDLQRAAVAEAEEAHAKELARQMNERDKIKQENKQEKLKNKKLNYVVKKNKKKRKYEEHRIQVQKFFADQQAALTERLSLMKLKEQEKEREVLKKQAEVKEKMAEKRQAIEERIERNIQAAEYLEQRRKEEFLQKQQEFEETRAKHLEKLEMERKLKAEEQKLQEQRRRIIIIQQRDEEEKKKEELQERFADTEEHVQQVQDMRAKELEIMRERRNLRMQMKAENVMRVKRVNDYGALKTLKKIEDNDQRTARLQREKRELIEQRKRVAAEARLQKEAMIRAMESLRTNGAEADKVIKKSLSGKASIAEIVSNTGAETERSKRRKSKNKKNKTTSELLGVSRSKSAGAESEIDFHTHLQQRSQDSAPVPLPYISPYDTTYEPNESKT
eukprot:CAMPEP_0182418818 /NCGR_PEP_ID=MMETSP1167-20130531/3190_1 /TAXON_ID=2988 /ORGANISM="Mallomonas Sp, Strain CCMP3275" /LENGTH=638 /DNA_ID=CAMNT_0024593231 /DNA_START=29 /DNA_END=1946 /DNA_ORIENTATION=+